MQRSIALARLKTLLGKSFSYRINEKAPTAEERAEAKEKRPTVVAERDRIKEALESRRKIILEADQEYQSLVEAYRAACKRATSLALDHSYKITVGKNIGIFFVVEAQGDSWEDIFEKLAKKKAA